MKKAVAFALSAVTVLCVLAPAHAQDANPQLYAEIGYTQLNAKETFGANTAKFSPSAISGVVGYQFTPNLAVEGLVGFGAGKGDIKVNGVDSTVDGKVKNAIGVFFKPSFAVSDSIDLFGRIGWVRTELEVSAAGVSVSDSGNDVAYGVGANFNLSKTSYIQANWMNYYKKDGLKVDGFTVAYGMRF